jgi:hypothetical protein
MSWLRRRHDRKSSMALEYVLAYHYRTPSDAMTVAQLYAFARGNLWRSSMFTPAAESCLPRNMALLELREVISLHRDLPTLVHERDGFIQSPTSSNSLRTTP